MLRIEPLGTRILLPAFVVGYELTGDAYFAVDDFDDSPPWLITLEQQAGGYCMSYPSVLGAVLRFADNAEHSQSDINIAIRGFQAMAEDPDHALLRREFPELANLVCTNGQDYDSTQLRRLERFVARFFNISQLESGLEAFVRMAPCDPLAYFENWQVLTAVVKAEPQQLYRRRKSIHIDESKIGSLELTTEPFTKESLGTIREFGKPLRMEDVRGFLLWENSD